MRVLIVDDDAKGRAAERQMLQEEGFEVAEAGGADQAVLAFRGSGADVILCDLFMPGRDGLGVLDQPRRDSPGVKVVVMSGGRLPRHGEPAPEGRGARRGGGLAQALQQGGASRGARPRPAG